jgi:hypothetical protein
MENYIVRIYRRTPNESENIVGVIEKPDNGENKEFRNSEELFNILVRRQTVVRPDSLKQTVERRKFRRFSLKESSLLFDSTTGLGEVIDLSMGGLAFSCLEMPENFDKSFRAGTLYGEDGYQTDTIRYRNVFDDHASEATALVQTERRRCRVEFDDLNPNQSMQLEYIIRNYTVKGA